MSTSLENTNYHRILRVSAAVLAVVLIFESGLVAESTRQLSQNTHLYLANAVGMTVGVEPNELNSITAELTTQKRMLDARESELREREIAVQLNSGPINQRATYILASVLFVLLVLILLNYTLDFMRMRREQLSDTATV